MKHEQLSKSYRLLNFFLHFELRIKIYFCFSTLSSTDSSAGGTGGRFDKDSKSPRLKFFVKTFGSLDF